jgi:hypothetical protein
MPKFGSFVLDSPLAQNWQRPICMKNRLFAAIVVSWIGCAVHAQNYTQMGNGQNPYVQTNPPPPVTADYVHKFGVGLELGAPIGVNAKYWLSDCTALDAAVGWSPYAHSAAEIHADFLVHDFDLLTVPNARMPVYLGGGILGRLRDDNRSNLAGFRFPFGVSYMFNNAPVDVFAEVAPEIIFAPFARGGVDAGIGFRIWF